MNALVFRPYVIDMQSSKFSHYVVMLLNTYKNSCFNSDNWSFCTQSCEVDGIWRIKLSRVLMFLSI